MQTNPEPDLHCISHVGTDGVLYVTRFRPNFGSNGAIGNWYSTNGETLTGSAMTYHNGYFYHSHTGLDGKIYTRKSPNCRQNTWTAWQSTGEPGEFTRNAPALASHDGYLFQAHVGNNNGVYVRKTTNGSNWT